MIQPQAKEPTVPISLVALLVLLCLGGAGYILYRQWHTSTTVPGSAGPTIVLPAGTVQVVNPRIDRVDCDLVSFNFIHGNGNTGVQPDYHPNNVENEQLIQHLRWLFWHPMDAQEEVAGRMKIPVESLQVVRDAFNKGATFNEDRPALAKAYDNFQNAAGSHRTDAEGQLAALCKLEAAKLAPIYADLASTAQSAMTPQAVQTLLAMPMRNPRQGRGGPARQGRGAVGPGPAVNRPFPPATQPMRTLLRIPAPATRPSLLQTTRPIVLPPPVPTLRAIPATGPTGDRTITN